MTTIRSKITGTGMYVPAGVVTNDDLAQRMDTSDEWIRQRSGIAERRHVDGTETPADLALQASQRALEAAGVGVNEIDAIILATLSPQHDFPGTSFFLHERLGAPEIPCFDLRAQCSGFLYSLATADAFIRSGQMRRILVVGNLPKSVVVRPFEPARIVRLYALARPERPSLAAQALLNTVATAARTRSAPRVARK